VVKVRIGEQTLGVVAEQGCQLCTGFDRHGSSPFAQDAAEANKALDYCFRRTATTAELVEARAVQQYPARIEPGADALAETFMCDETTIGESVNLHHGAMSC
jgi:hypothetical protein